MSTAIVPQEIIEKKIYLVRGKKVMFDKDLAQLYGVLTKNLNKAVKRNIERFPEDFMFQLNQQEIEVLRFQIGTSKNLGFQFKTSKKGRGGRRYLPYVFTQEGIAMLSGVLHSPRAIHVNIQIMRTFVRLREFLASHKDLAHKLEELEKRYDAQFKAVFDAIRQIMNPPEVPKRRVGFHTEP